ncbi:MAG: hypothetical protein LBN12_08205, partial [Clostridiales Family XIII bacterium]|nr:hypothetical protein [Clostridiales Family XIII bacterium]
FALPKNGPYGYEEEFYSFDYGQVHVLVLSSNYQDPQESYSADGAERDQIAARVAGWIAEDLSSTEKPHSIVMMHHPIFPIVSDSMTAGLQDEWLPIFMGAGVELVLVGHQHEYMRTKPWMSGTSGGGLVQIMANTSQKTYPISGSGLGYIDVEIGDTQGYLYITATEDSLEVIAYNAKGRIIDTWTSEPTKEGKKAA